MRSWEAMLKVYRLDWWRIGAVFFLACFVVSVLCFLMLKTTYEEARDIVYQQQTDIIDEQARIIRQQHQTISELTGDNTTVPVKPPLTY